MLRPWVIAVAVALGGCSAEAQTACERLRDGDGLHLAGRVGAADVSVYLDTGWPSRAGDESGVSGLVLDRARWMASEDDGLLALDGRMLNDCRLELKELQGNAEWHLRIVSARRAEGTREADDRSTPLAFTIVPPVDCSAGPWKTFASAAWPVTFEYPASARFGPGITIACPDVERLAWGAMPLTIESADLEKDESGGLRRVGPFLRDPSGRWHVGEDEECEAGDKQSRLCGPASETRWRGFTVLQGESVGEDRHYRPGGGSYIGQGGGAIHYVFLLDDKAILVTGDELPQDIASLNRPPPANERSVRLMMRRIVRSLKRR